MLEQMKQHTKYVAVDMVVKDSKKFLTETVELTDDIFDAATFETIQDCQYFLDANNLSRRASPISVSYYLNMAKLSIT